MCASSRRIHSKVPSKEGLGNFLKMLSIHSPPCLIIIWGFRCDLAFKSRHVCFLRLFHYVWAQDGWIQAAQSTLLLHLPAFSTLNLKTFEVPVYCCTLVRLQKTNKQKNTQNPKQSVISFRDLSWFTFRVTKGLGPSDVQNKISFLHSSV